MNSILFILRRTMKNRLLALKRKPAMLVLYLLVTVIIVISLINTGNNPISSENTMDFGWLKLIFTAYLMIFLFTGISKNVDCIS